jgi:beta-galactosidase
MIRNMRRLILFLAVAGAATAADRSRYNFNVDWKMLAGDAAGAEATAYDDSGWKTVSMPQPVGTAWYRKHFKLPAGSAGQKVFLEFEGISGEFYLNGKSIGRHENGAAPLGFDLTTAARPAPMENVLAARVANSSAANVWLHITSKLHQTLPLHSTLNTTGVYVYASDFDIAGQSARVTAEAQVKNEFDAPRTFTFDAIVHDGEDRAIATLGGGSHTLRAGETATIEASGIVQKLRFWSWGYGYLYTVSTVLKVNGQPVDSVATRTGFRKTEFANGMVKLNDRAIQLKGYIQQSPNEWPLVGSAVPAWLSDYSNRMTVDGNGNLVRWAPAAPSRQDVESCDRVGLLEAVPVGHADLARDILIYNRNNPSIIFYEGGADVKAALDEFDSHGGRAADAAQRSGLEKSAARPLWTTEYPGDGALSNVLNWYQFWSQRPGTGDRVTAGGVTTMDASAMRIPRDGYFANQVMWDGWVDTEHPLVRILGNWAGTPGTKRDVLVVSNAERVELRLNNQSLGNGQRSGHFLFTFPNVEWQEGTLQAIASDSGGRRAGMARLDSPLPPAYINLNLHSGHNGLMADGADLALVDVEVMDGTGRRCPAAANRVRLTVSGPAELIGDSIVSAEDGIRRVFLRSTHQPGRIVLQANSDALQMGVIDWVSRPVAMTSGLSAEPLGDDLQPYLGKGATPGGSPYKNSRTAIHIVSATAGSNPDQAGKSYDDDEATQWESDGQAGSNWIEYRFDDSVSPAQMTLKLADFQNSGHAIRITVDGTEVFAGSTGKSLGYVTVPLKPATGRSLRLEGTAPAKLSVVEAEIYR